MSEKEWYNTKKLERYANDANLIFVVGERRIGKTLHFLQKAFELWYSEHKSTMWLRNKKIEFQDPSFVKDFLNAPKKFGWCDENVICFPDGVYTDKNKTEQIIKFQSISTFSNRRGNMTDDVYMMVLDEFMPEDRKFPKRCHIALLSLIKTVMEGREDGKCYCLSNFISSANPYFVGFRIYPKKEYDVTYYKDKGIAIEVCRGYRNAIQKDNPWNRVFEAGRYQDYGEAEEDHLFNLVCKIPKGGELNHIFLISEGITYGNTFANGLVYFHEVKPTTKYVYATTLQETTDKINLLPKFYKKMIEEWSNNNLLRFSNPNVMYAILSIIYETV